jgi:peroxiredoxin
MSHIGSIAPPLQVAQWFNAVTPLTLNALRGRVVVLHAFQMLCPGCVSQGIPQAMKVHAQFPSSEVVVLGLHTVFEHHDVMGPNALKAFLHEYRITFPVGVDLAVTGHRIPATMQAYELRGTPSLVVIDRHGVIRLNHFGHIEDLQLGALIGTLVCEGAAQNSESNAALQNRPAPTAEMRLDCNDSQCEISKKE